MRAGSPTPDTKFGIGVFSEAWGDFLETATPLRGKKTHLDGRIPGNITNKDVRRVHK